ncbi:potassium channel family protein [Cesiribacter andamanensis]|uniref:Ion channel n=1 Tax=Cesiribacter andamanensis AMV16 TaxID=1279009 RepID=M7N8B2_9BACT|nr:potassium channel family protein [Cesiribacter andamanensis]EMR03451.1 Ion channel [Cesiribacter andamanensis AMV16]
MNWILLLAGIILTSWAILEGLWTTLWIDGNSAPVTGRITSGIWQAWKHLFRHRHKALSLAGPLVLIVTVVSWILFIWLGWTLIFAAEQGSLMSSKGEIPDFWGRAWYVAYCMFTIGNGDYLPQGSGWQLVSSFVGFSGMGMVTLSITYIFQIVSAVVTKRSFSSQITSIATEADAYVKQQWTGTDFGAIELQLNALSGQLDTLNEQHLAYPILHYYHAQHSEKSIAIALPVLDDALIIIGDCVAEEYRPARTLLMGCRSSIGSYLKTLRAAHIHAAREVPPLPNWHALREAGLPLCSREEFEGRFRKWEDRRKLMLGVTQNAAWRWPSTL